MRNLTQDWLNKHGFVYNSLLLVGSHDKRAVCKENDISLVIEDSMENAKLISTEGIPVLLMDAPYNRGLLPPLIDRKKSWPEICETILDLCNLKRDFQTAAFRSR